LSFAAKCDFLSTLKDFGAAENTPILSLSLSLTLADEWGMEEDGGMHGNWEGVVSDVYEHHLLYLYLWLV